MIVISMFLRVFCCSDLGIPYYGTQQPGRHHIFGKSTTRPLLPCNSENHGTKADLSMVNAGRGNKGVLGTSGSPAAEVAAWHDGDRGLMTHGAEHDTNVQQGQEDIATRLWNSSTRWCVVKLLLGDGGARRRRSA